MNKWLQPLRSFVFALLVWLAVFSFIKCSSANAQVVTNDPPFYGPFNGVFLPDGEGLKKPLLEHDSVLQADSPWSLYFWLRPAEVLRAPTLLAGIGNPTEEFPRYVGLDDGKLMLWMGKNNSLASSAVLNAVAWHFLAATFDGTEFHLYSDGAEVAKGKLDLGSVGHVLQMAPPDLPWPNGKHFGGKIATLTLLRRALTPEEIKQLHAQPANVSSILFEEGSKPWSVQTRAQAGYRAPQDPATMPSGKGALSRPVARAPLPSQPALQPSGENEWTLAAGWTITPAPKVNREGPQISTAGFNDKDWWPATIPGTVLTTMVDRGVYPDPDYGLNNLAIPESLNKQDYWYRNEFKAPANLAGRHLTLTFQGINYKAEVWLNGQPLGTITGAFIRGVFDVTNSLKPGQANALAVRVSPPPHPGIPQEQSIKGGPGENGGIMCLDGPTFVATEGWDWIPAIRDRDTGIWQPVTLTATGSAKIGDPQVVTKLPLPDTSRADVEITVPLENNSASPIHGALKATFDQTSVSKSVVLPPGKSSVKLAPAEFPQLAVQNPRLWWPNGYGKPELYHLTLSLTEGEKESDSKQVTFGIREITYELSLLDTTGHLRRLEYSPTAARANNERVVDVSLEGMREIPAADPFPPNFPESWKEWWHSWVASLAPGAESSSAIRILEDTKVSPYLVIKVNGFRIACRGGNWGMDDSRKRVSRARLEPYFRLHRDAHLNFIRNWVGQDTEQVFYDLADEYGLLIWNDFWESTQNYNVEAQDPVLFLDNARDTILRFRNHPSIAMWCGRNEGVPQPIINDGLTELIRSLDGTRYYSPSSNQVNLQNSGPYKYQDPALYFTALNHGFSVETGTPSLSTLESFRAWIPKEDQWPINDVWAYHDWHASGNGETAPFMAEIQSEFGAPTSLEDFERKAQMLNYVDHRAIFEGMNAHLWAPNSGRVLWMTQPAWPSNMWQILSSDYDTQASYYGTKKACEPIHIQLNLSNFNVDIVNNTTAPLPGLSVAAVVLSLDNKQLLQHEEKKDAAANAATNAFKLALAPLFSNGVVLVKLELHNAAGQLLSDNFYWLASDSASYRQLNKLPAATLSATADSKRTGDTVRIHIHIQNRGTSAVLADKLTLLNAADGSRILPAYFTDNYFSLLPGESREINIDYPASATQSAPQLALRGWNLPTQTIPVTPQK
jgi:Exo-beta-D-glucosaminidase Ig-fold domain/Glycosyl hydrolases family 2/Concanavalin A-like lectin/glucanases superfamily/Glycosyl hydrolases family 2, sugar binding domain/Glycosyl hydrolases family 2, TIM barrel domain